MLNISSEVLSDFNEILEDIGEDVIVYRPTKTLSNVGLDEEVAYGSAINMRVVFQLTDVKYIYDREGIIEMGDATVYSLTTNSLENDTKVVRNNSTYKIGRVVPREGLDMCVLYRWT